MRPSDAPAPQFIVVAVHDEYEQSVRLFITEEAAVQEYMKWKNNSVEVYLSRIIEVK